MFRRFNVWKERRYSLKKRLGGSQSWYGRFWKHSLLALLGFESRTVQAVASRYTTPAPRQGLDTALNVQPN
jgi:hypothetical protein